MADNVKKEMLLKINKYKRSDNTLEKALELCNNPDFINDVSIQHQKMEVLCMLNRFKEAIAIGERPEFAKEMSIQLKLIEAYMGIKDFEKALAICNLPEYIEHPGFIQKAKRIKKDLLRINGAEVKITSEDFNDYIHTIDDLINMAKNDKNPGRARKLLQKALGYCSNEAFKDNLDAILYKIKTLKLLGEYQIALEIANDKMSLNNIDIFIQIISILTHFKRYDEALSLIDKSPFKDNPNIKNQKQSILLKKEGKVAPKSRSALNPTNKDAKKVSLNDLLDFIENKRLSIETISSLPISQLLKDIFIVAYYEVRDDQEQAFQYIGNMASSYENNDDCLKIIEELEKHFDGKKITYSRLLYQKLLIISQSININNSRK